MEYSGMPTIARVSGCRVAMYYGDHDPPHVHVWCAGERCKIDIRTGSLLAGQIPPGTFLRVQRWIAEHNMELIADWTNAQHFEALPYVW